MMTIIDSNMQNFYILTGAPGSGKTTLGSYLKKNKDIVFVSEPARVILAEQRAIDGAGVPEKDPELFVNLLLQRAIEQYEEYRNSKKTIIFDRGVPDYIAYAKLFGLDIKPYAEAAEKYNYNKNVFFLPSWQEIYQNDDERKMSFEAAKKMGDDLKQIYQKLGYSINTLPKDKNEARVSFIKSAI